ncbi:hypothetical protein FZEAL_1699 [Fusarium zealandicum]|uniref:MARVEL domain-containing protein n=1 Tax=Fusarium zealandicum TaxID=1053134 RepID=A0A8H4XNI5_9HYPO|nr:hypothetical protein FZEAL_1699 [Fusarium zealandicum]
MATATSTQGLTATGVPPMPFWLTILRGIALLFALGTLIAAAYHISLLGGIYAAYFGGSGPAGFLIFDAVFTFLLLGPMLAAEFFAPQLYLRLLFVGALVLAAVFWLAAWAWAASWAATFYSHFDQVGYGFGAWGASIAAGAALGAITWQVPL